MTFPAPQRDRRREARQARGPDRIAWTRAGAVRTSVGWVHDVAASGIAFVAPTRDKPSPGERIELTFDPGGRFARHGDVQVVHTVRYDRFFSLVGCRAAPGD